ncbi:MAG: response regulator transcription factor [Coprobacillus cateniformis]
MYKILLVEDDINIINHLSSFLEKEGFLITHVDGQKKAINLINNQHFDLAILDISLKEGNGYSLYNEIKSYKDIPIVFLTANQDEFSVVTGLNLGADDYISKPFRPRELLSRIQNILRRYHKQETFINIKTSKSIP